MLYQVSRNGQTYGPYTLEDLSRYVELGNVQLTDMVKGEESSEWVTVAHLLHRDEPAPAAMPVAYAPPYAGAGTYDPPPNLSWGLVLLFGLLTCTVFMYIWNLILAVWANRIAPNSKVLILYIAGTVLRVIELFAEARANLLPGGMHQHPNFDVHGSGAYAGVAFVCWVVRLIARFTMRNTLEEHYNTVDPIGLRLSGVMTFFFGGIYFQYHLNRINDIKRAMSYRGAGF